MIDSIEDFVDRGMSGSGLLVRRNRVGFVVDRHVTHVAADSGRFVLLNDRMYGF